MSQNTNTNEISMDEISMAETLTMLDQQSSESMTDDEWLAQFDSLLWELDANELANSPLTV